MSSSNSEADEISELLDTYQTIRRGEFESSLEPEPESEPEPEPEPTSEPDYSPKRRDTVAPIRDWRTGTTRVYSAGHSQVFHADRTCRELESVEQIRPFPLRFVVTHEANPNRPCHHCTMDIDHTIDVALAYDSVEPEDVVYEVDCE